MILAIAKIDAQNYLISFVGTGASAVVDSVKVENLAQETSFTIPGNDTLHLTGDADIKENDACYGPMIIYPNPAPGHVEFLFYAKRTGHTRLVICDISGKEVLQNSGEFFQGYQRYRITGLEQGMYFVTIQGENYSYTTKLISSYSSHNEMRIEFIENADVNRKFKSIKTISNMSYTAGDTMSFTGFSGTYTAIVHDVPTASKIITFYFDTIPNCGFATDIDGNDYNTVQIGTQCWMRENLKTGRYSNGDTIANVTDVYAWAGSGPAFCWYNNDSASFESTYGKIYNLKAVSDTRNICPSGWHVPADSDWTVLTDFLGNDSIAGGKLKETGFVHWANPNTGATNITGFTALPGGSRYSNNTFEYLGSKGLWWSSTHTGGSGNDGWYRMMSSNSKYVNRYNGAGYYGLSVRCLRD